MAVCFNAPPGWPVPPESWVPHDDWMPDPGWPTPPRGWTFWTVTERRAQPLATAAGAYGTDRGTWLATLRARAASGALMPAAAAALAPTPAADAAADPDVDPAAAETSSEPVDVTHLETVAAPAAPAAPAAESAVAPAVAGEDSDGAWGLDGLLTSAGWADA